LKINHFKKDDKLFFAGEATTSYIGTVHGGFISGITAAKTLETLIDN
jgi:monoamine oxidase